MVFVSSDVETLDDGSEESLTGSIAGPSFFSNARNFTLNNPTMSIVQGNQYITNLSPEKRNLDEVLKPADQSAYYTKPCMEGTRQAILREIDEWTKDPSAKNILWLSGSPGAGKSAIAKTLVLKLSSDCRMHGYFFFKRGHDTFANPGVTWRTICHRLAQYNDAFADEVCKYYEEKRVDPSTPDITNHFRYLVEEPLATFRDNMIEQTGPVIVIDALDECGLKGRSDHQRRTFLETLCRWASLDPRFKLVITGRDDDRMPESLRDVCHHLPLLTGSNVSPDSSEDLRLYFTTRLKEIPHKRLKGWSYDDIANELTRRAAGLFIWAETVMNFLHQDVLEKQLRQVLSGDFGGGEDMNKLYSQILTSSFDGVHKDTLEAVPVILGAIILSRVPLFYDDLAHIVPQVENSTVDFILDRLSSVISSGNSGTRLFIFHLSFTDFLCDRSRCDGRFAVDSLKGNLDFALACFRIMRENLHFNICGLETSHLSNDAVPDMSQRIQTHVPSFLAYSCRFWPSHTSIVEPTHEEFQNLLSEIKTFFSERFLFWLEVMSLIKAVSEAGAVLTAASTWLDVHSRELSLWSRDSSRFIRYFYEPISQSVPHIYLSALPFAPTESWVHKQYRARYPRTLSLTTGVDKHWPACISALTGHTNWVNSVAVSSDGTKVVSGSRDRTVLVWDLQTGQTVLGPLQINGWLISVRFSRDGKEIFACCDESVFTWDVETGEQKSLTSFMWQQPVTSGEISWDGGTVAYGFPGGTISLFDTTKGAHLADFGGIIGVDRMSSIAFSADSTRIVAGSEDGIVCVWDITSRRRLAGPYEHEENHLVRSVAFSSCGTKVVSAARRTIRVWDVIRDECVAGPFLGHTDDITSASFSPDDTLVVTGSHDRTVRVWDVKAGKTVAGPFEGHTDWLASVCFSPDGSAVLSASHDCTIRLWDVKAGISPEHSDSHSERVNSACFSPDGTRVASGADDRTIHIWDVNSGEKHLSIDVNSKVNALGFSSDGNSIVSGSRRRDIYDGIVTTDSLDGAIHVWDADTGMLTAGPFESRPIIESIDISPDGSNIAAGHYGSICIWDVKLGRMTAASPFEAHTGSITSVHFSPDGSRLVSCSSDKSIRVWSAHDGKMVLGPLEGHTAEITSVRFSRGGMYLVSGSRDRTVRMWDAATGQPHAGPFGYYDPVESVDISPDGTSVVAGTSEGGIMICSTSDGKMKGMVEVAHTGRVRSVMFSPDGKKLVSGGGDSVSVWSVERLCLGDASGVSEDQTKTISPINVFELTSCRSIQSWGWAVSRKRRDPLHATAEYADPPANIHPPAPGNYLFWVPPAHRRILCDTDTFVIMGSRRTEVDLCNFVHGTSWTKCGSPRIASRFSGETAVFPPGSSDIPDDLESNIESTITTSYTQESGDLQVIPGHAQSGTCPSHHDNHPALPLAVSHRTVGLHTLRSPTFYAALCIPAVLFILLSPPRWWWRNVPFSGRRFVLPIEQLVMGTFYRSIKAVVLPFVALSSS